MVATSKIARSERDTKIEERFSQDLDRVLGTDIDIAVREDNGAFGRKRIQIIRRITLCGISGFAVHEDVRNRRRSTYFAVSDVETGFAAGSHAYRTPEMAISMAESGIRLNAAMKGVTPEQMIAKAREAAAQQLQSEGNGHGC